ncbi:MAG: hypothetical protein Udaeo2_30330 [Candidatus Udaeobacter sp.]|nr:MAG: hypothetical protein Udaeo2_30330 [Candidatus Udaeobacter sp.]
MAEAFGTRRTSRARRPDVPDGQRGVFLVKSGSGAESRITEERPEATEDVMLVLRYLTRGELR